MVTLALTVTGTLSPVASAQAAPSSAQPTSTASTASTDADPHAVLVRFRSGVSAPKRAAALTRRAARVDAPVRGTGWVKVRAAGPATDLLAALRTDPSVAAASLDHRRHTAAVPNDPAMAGDQFPPLNVLRLPKAWDYVKSSAGQVIAVVDTGVNLTHEDLAGRLVPGFNAIDPAAQPVDDNGHGSMVAGVAAADTDNGKGIAGVAWGGRIMPVKAVGADGSGSDSDIIEGIVWAADHGATVINLSLVGPDDNPALHEAITYATGRGAVVVAAAGNEGTGVAQYPAAYPEVIAVGATDGGGNLTDFSSYGDWLDLVVPGLKIHSTGLDQSYPVVDGTSFSAALVSGVAALVRTKYPDFTPARVRERLTMTARDSGPRGLDPYYGYGVVDSFRAVGSTGTSLPFPQPDMYPSEPNDVPARATPVAPIETWGRINTGGDVDWYRFDVAARRGTTLSLRPTDYSALSHNPDLAMTLYDADLRRIAAADATGRSGTEQLTATVDAGRHYVAVRNDNGSHSSAYWLKLTDAAAGTAPPAGEQVWVRDVSPADFALDQPVTLRPTVTFTRPVAPGSVTGNTVQLLDGRGRYHVDANLTVTGNVVTIVPKELLFDNNPYRIVVDGVTDTAGVTQSDPFTTTFKTRDLPPGPLSSFSVIGTYRGVHVRLGVLPRVIDYDRTIVRMATGTTPPSSPTSGTEVPSNGYVGNLTPGTTYSFSAWVRDKAGNLSKVSTARAAGTATTIASSPTSLVHGTAQVTVTGRLTRTDTGAAIAFTSVQLHARPKGATSFTYLGSATSTSTGALTYPGLRPDASTEYKWVYRGSNDETTGQAYIGAASQLKLVSVAPYLSAKLSRTSFALGGTVTLSGTVTPGHPSQTIYLQRSIGGVWKDVATGKLTSTSAYAFTVKPAARGTYWYRVRKPADSDHLEARSPARSFTVS
ncbi:Serine protease, subtilisin family [Micromonospora mirobrigensis]|uniref:Serine protease, subtilisin family n=1 Tax=Micromonospora mirobrigensis TaxID=262898 RepID=A0A1C4VAR4_9ACTN|nr:Serine protease, subtilisin family [Micromonospora mirobrigensis]